MPLLYVDQNSGVEEAYADDEAYLDTVDDRDPDVL